MIGDLLESLPPTLASAFLPPAFTSEARGFTPWSTTIIPIFQTISVLPMGRVSTLHPPPQVPLLCFYTLNGGLFLIYII